MALLHEATGKNSPFTKADTVYFILGDGRGRRALAAVRKAATAKPAELVVTIDPEYASENRARGGRGRPKGQRGAAPNKRRYTSTRQVLYVGGRAEGYKFDRGALGRAGRAVVVAVGAHTNAGSFVARLRKAAGARLPVFAVCAPCCCAGLRAPTEKLRIERRPVQLLYPRAARTTRQRPLAAKARRAAERDARRWNATSKHARARARAHAAQRARREREGTRRAARPERGRTLRAKRRARLPAAARRR